MGQKGKFIVVLALICLLGGLLYAGVALRGGQEDGALSSVLEKDDDDLVLWYTDAHLTDYLNSVALNYQDDHDIRVIPVLVSGVEYLEELNKASTAMDGSGPDLYIAGNDMLAKAYLAGLAGPVEDIAFLENGDFPDTSLDAVTYRDKIIAYPYYYETSFLLYNRTYLEDSARQNLENAANQAEGQQAMELIEAAESEAAAEDQVVMEGETSPLTFSEEDLNGEMENLIPKTIEGILSFSDTFEAPEQVENVFKWTVSDIFYNYFFVGNYITVGGEAGDDYSQFDIMNQEAVDCLNMYQSLNQFFSIDTSTVTYDAVIEEFLQGKTVFTAATTDALHLLQQAEAAGEFTYDYGVAVMPDVSDELRSRSLSVTNTVVINEYSENKEAADAFARMLVTDTQQLTQRTGKVPCYMKSAVYEEEAFRNVLAAYESSISMPKMIEASNFWVQLEMVFTKVWNGNDAAAELQALADQIGSQIDEGIDNLNPETDSGLDAGAAVYLK